MLFSYTQFKYSDIKHLIRVSKQEGNVITYRSNLSAWLMPLLHKYAHTKYMKGCTYIQITIKTMKYKVKRSSSFFSGNWKLILHKTSAPRSISVNDDATIINQNYPKAGTQGTHRYYAQIPVQSLIPLCTNSLTCLSWQLASFHYSFFLW